MDINKVAIYEAQIRGENIKLGIESEKVKIEMLEVEKAKAKAQVYKTKMRAYEFMLPYYRDMIKDSISAAPAIIIKNE